MIGKTLFLWITAFGVSVLPMTTGRSWQGELATARVVLRPQEDQHAEAETHLIVRGRTSTFTVVGKTLAQTRSVEFEPPDGVKVVEIKKLETRPNGLRAVSIVLSVAADAQPGMRAADLKSADPGNEIVFFTIGTHALAISNLQTEVFKPGAEEAGYAFQFEDEAGDIQPEAAGTTILVEIKCGRTSTGVHIVPARIELQNPNRGSVYLSLARDRFTYAARDCQLRLRLQDKDGNQSNALKTIVPFSNATGTPAQRSVGSGSHGG